MRKLSKQEFLRGDKRADLSQVIHLIDEYDLYQYSLFQKTFNTINMSKEQARNKVEDVFSRKINTHNPQHQYMITQLQNLIKFKDESTDLSEFGLKVWFGLPFIIDHSLDFEYKETLQKSYLRYIQSLHLKDQKLSSYLIYNSDQILETNQKQVLSLYLIDLLIIRGTKVFVHENGIFPSVCPNVYEKRNSSPHFDVHFLKWEEQLFLLIYIDDLEFSLNVLQQIYKTKQFPAYLLTQSNWRYAFEKHFDQSYDQEELEDLSIEKQYKFVEPQKIKMTQSEIATRMHNAIFHKQKEQNSNQQVKTLEKQSLPNLFQSFDKQSLGTNQEGDRSKSLQNNIEKIVEDLILLEITIKQNKIKEIKEYLTKIMENQTSQINLNTQMIKCQNDQSLIIFLNGVEQLTLLGSLYNEELKDNQETLRLLQLYNYGKKCCEKCFLFYEMIHLCFNN